MKRDKRITVKLIFQLIIVGALISGVIFGYAMTTRNYPVVLMYHLVLDEPYSDNHSLFVRPLEFEKQLAYLAEEGYNFLFADQYSACNVKSVILTFDDGYDDNYSNVLPLLKKFNAKATIFLAADCIGRPGYLAEDQIVEMQQSGLISFGSHTMSHQDLSSLTNNEIHYELSNSKAEIERITGKTVTALSYPYGNCNFTVSSIAKQYYSVAFVTAGNRFSFNHYHIRRIAVDRDMDIITFRAKVNSAR